MSRREIIFSIVALLSVAAYLTLSFARGTLGFPLDDAWIHQVYARNIGTHGEFAFFSGLPSAGSTSPLWTILLGVGYALRIDYRVWAYLLGVIFFGASVILIARLVSKFPISNFQPPISNLTIYCSLFALFEWHLVWSAASGMEIPLFIFLSLLIVERFFARERDFILGLIAGLLTLTRPEGTVLGALVGLGVIVKKSPLPSPLLKRAGEIALYALGFAILLLPYLTFNLATSGAIFPNTFYAKNAEYAILLQQPLWLRLAQMLAAPWVGAQALLLPGFIFIIIRLFKMRDWGALAPSTWIFALPTLYALRLPVTYQHARYEMPVVPFIVVYGVWGTVELFGRVRSFVVRSAWAASIAVVLISFWGIGAVQYAVDVAFIDCEMVQTARWAAQNVPSDAVIAAHDIGALGYFYPRPFIDLAGLVSPEVIPFIRNEPRLKEFLQQHKTQYVIVFPDWYDTLARDLVPVFQTNCAVTRAEGGTNLGVYRVVR